MTDRLGNGVDGFSGPALQKRPLMSGKARYFRSLQTLFAALALILSCGASALGVGEPRHISPLFEPLRVDIPIEGAASADLQVRLMMVSSSHETVGLDLGGHSVSSLLHQELVDSGNGQRVLRVSTDRIINEPLMTLQVDVTDGGAHIRRELTLLFDPPEVSATAEIAATVPSVQAPAVASSPVSTAIPAVADAARDARPVPDVLASAVPPRRVHPVRSKVKSSSSKAPVVAKTSLPAPAPSPEKDVPSAAVNTKDWQQYGPVEVGETVMMVADRLRPSPELSITAMAALLRWLNPEAFLISTGDLRPGAVLHYPDPTTLAASAAAFRPIETSAAAKIQGGASAPSSAPVGGQSGLQAAPADIQISPAPTTSTEAQQQPSAVSPIAAAGILTPRTARPASAPFPIANDVFPAWLVTSMAILTLLTFGALVQVMRMTPRRAAFTGWLDDGDEDKVISPRTLDLGESDAGDIQMLGAELAPMSASQVVDAAPQEPEPVPAPQPPTGNVPLELPEAFAQPLLPPLVTPDWELLNEPPPHALADPWPDQASLAAMEVDPGLALAQDAWSPDQFDLLLPDVDSDNVQEGKKEPGWQTINTPAVDPFDLEPDVQRVIGQVRRQ